MFHWASIRSQLCFLLDFYEASNGPLLCLYWTSAGLSLGLPAAQWLRRRWLPPETLVTTSAQDTETATDTNSETETETEAETSPAHTKWWYPCLAPPQRSGGIYHRFGRV